jgi:Flp pilus assembly protein CpaB
VRLSLWFILIFAFSLGMCCAISIRTFYFEKKPAVGVQKTTTGATTKILIAKRTIPDGVGITADFLYFQEVPVSEVPVGALSNFNQVFRRQPTIPIPEGYPICEDLLLSPAETAARATYMPTGSQFVTLDVVNIQQGNKTFAPKESLSKVLSAEQRIDVRVIPRDDVQGKFAEMKNALLRSIVAHDFRSTGDIVLENVPIHEFQKRPVVDSTGLSKESLVLALDKSEAARLAAAAKKGRIRIVVHQSREAEPPPFEQPVDVPEQVIEVAEQPPTLLVTLPPEQPLPLDIALPEETVVQEPIGQEPTELTATVSENNTQKTASVPEDIVDAVLPTAPMPEIAIFSTVHETNALPSPSGETHPPSFPVFAEREAKERIPIRNDVPLVSLDSGTPSLAKQTPTEQSPAEQSPAEQSPKVADSFPVGGEPGQEALARPFPETMWRPRVSQSIQFIAPGNVVPAREHPREPVSQAAGIPAVLPPVNPPVLPPAQLSVTPSLVPAPTITLPEKTGVPGYSPWERRSIYTVLPNDVPDNSSTGKLPPPARL